MTTEHLPDHHEQEPADPGPMVRVFTVLKKRVDFVRLAGELAHLAADPLHPHDAPEGPAMFDIARSAMRRVDSKLIPSDGESPTDDKRQSLTLARWERESSGSPQAYIIATVRSRSHAPVLHAVHFYDKQTVYAAVAPTDLDNPPTDPREAGDAYVMARTPERPFRIVVGKRSPDTHPDLTGHRRAT